MRPVARSLVTIYCTALVLTPSFAVLLGAPVGPWAWGTGIVVVASLVALITWAATGAPRARGTAADPDACTCGFAGSMGGRDPQCPQHGQHTDPPGSTGVRMNRSTGGPTDGS